MIVVVGIGADGMAGLAAPSLDELRRATVVYGSRRQLDLMDDTVSAERRQWPSPMLDVLDTLRAIDGDVHVLASGDPMLHGVGRLLIRMIGADRVRILPHVSSVTLACTRLGWAVQETDVISLMTSEPHTAVRRGGQAVVLCRDGADPATLARLLADAGRGDSELTVLEQLGGPAERRRDATARQWAADPPGDVDDLNVVAVRYLPDDRSAVGAARRRVRPRRSDHQTVDAGRHARGVGTPTGELLWDVGAGSGSIAIEWCRSGSRLPGSGVRT